MTKTITTAVPLLSFVACLALLSGQPPAARLHIKQDEKTHTINVYRDEGTEPILTQNAIPDVRPYLHPIVAPDGKGLLTQYRPSHHPHQTGIFWGFKLVNGREFFMKWQGDYYRRVLAKVVEQKGQRVRWQTIYDMLDEKGTTVMTETQNWSMQMPGGSYVLDLEWRGEAKTDVTLGKSFVGGLFVRMPWHEGSRAEAVNAAGQRNHEAEAQRARWTDMGIQLEERSDLAHIAILDHPDNHGSPALWRVDTQFGFGPDLASTDLSIDKGKSEVARYRLIAYTGDLDPGEMTSRWKEFVRETADFK